LSSPGGTFKRGNPDALAVFADEAALKQPLQPDYLHEQISVTADTRDFRSHPWSGGVYRASMAAYSDRSTGLFSFRRYEAEAAHFVPLADRRIVLAGHAWLVGTGTVDNETVPFYLMPSLGGSNTIRAHTDYRFHDRNLLVVNAESRFALWTHLDLAAFADAGNVGPRMADLDLSKRAYGLGIRMHTGRATFLRLDAAHGSEGWRIVFRSNDPLHLTRLSRRTAAVPFAP
jgi:outer membrane protein assembly factor BamA